MKTSRNTTTSLARLNDFFYAKEVPFAMALVRITLCLILAWVSIRRWSYARELYSTDGAPAPLADGYGYFNFLPEFSGTMVVVLMSAMVFFFLTAAAGWLTRISLAAAMVLWVYFNMMDAIGSMTKYCVIASHALLLLAISDSGRVWSVDSILNGTWKLGRQASLGVSATMWPSTPVWPRRLMQLLVAVVYFGAGITKCQVTAYLGGDQMLHWAITNYNYPNFVGEYLTAYPALFVAMAYICLIWEIIFPFVCWKGLLRGTVLWLGVLFHVLTAIVLGLWTFPFVMIAIYFCFLEESEVLRLAVFFRRTRQRLRIPATFSLRRLVALPQASPLATGTAFALLLGSVVFAGVEAEYQMDPYGIRRPEGRHTLTEIPPEQAARMLRESEPIRTVDTFFSVDLGSTTMGSFLLNSRSEFRPGETVIAQCILMPPHADMWVECSLHDFAGRLIDRGATVIERNNTRHNFIFNMTDKYLPGEYSIQVVARGEKIMRRDFTLRSMNASPVAN